MKRLCSGCLCSGCAEYTPTAERERKNAMKLILASGSPEKKKELLTRAGAEFEVCVSDVDERGVSARPKKLFPNFSEMKGAAVLRSHKTIVCFRRRLASTARYSEKPKDADDALRMVEALAGRSHFAYTGVCVMFEKGR